MPTPSQVREYRYIHIFGDTLKQAELWSFNRNSVTKGFAVGIFCAFLPMPFEMVAALFMAAMLGGNIPVAISAVWLSNPLTWIPLYTPCYLLGARILSIKPIPIDQINILDLGLHYVALWLGCLIVGISLSLLSHLVLNIIWRSNIRRRWQERKLSRLQRNKTKTS